MIRDVQVDLCSWDEKIVESAGWLLVEERFADPDTPTMHHKFCSHDHLRHARRAGPEAGMRLRGYERYGAPGFAGIPASCPNGDRR